MVAHLRFVGLSKFALPKVLLQCDFGFFMVHKCRQARISCTSSIIRLVLCTAVGFLLFHKQIPEEEYHIDYHSTSHLKYIKFKRTSITSIHKGSSWQQRFILNANPNNLISIVLSVGPVVSKYTYQFETPILMISTQVIG